MKNFLFSLFRQPSASLSSNTATLKLCVTTGIAAIALVACGDENQEEKKTKKIEPIMQDEDATAAEPPPTDHRTVNLQDLEAPCKETEEDTARLIEDDNVTVVQFCRNRKWGNSFFEGSSMRCMDLGFEPVLTEDKFGVSCRNASGVISLNTSWKPSGRGLEACDVAEMNRWYKAFDKDGVRIAIRCTEMGRFDGLQPKSRFKCSDSDLSYKLTFINEGEGVACLRDDGDKQIYSLFTAQLGTYLSNANCPKQGQWEYYKSREGQICAGRCDATDDQVPGIFINQNSPGSTLCCPLGQVAELTSDKTSASCVTPTIF